MIGVNLHINIQGVNVLIEIGADINTGENGESPLCIAVQSRNSKMVECLLEHNVTNVNVREALKLSWELQLDFITGLLLERIAGYFEAIVDTSFSRSQDIARREAAEGT